MDDTIETPEVDKVYWSSEARGFFSAKSHKGHPMPSDIVEVSNEDHERLIAAQADFNEIVTGPDGYPTLKSVAPSEPVEMSLQDKLSAAGISIEELKAALGL